MDAITNSILEAAAQLLQAEGQNSLTTRRVAAAAGTQAPTIYRLFGDKEGLLTAVSQHVLANYLASKSEASTVEGESADSDPVSDLTAAFFLHVDFGVANPHVFALMTSLGGESTVDAVGREVLRARVRRVAAAGKLRVSEERAVQMISAAGNGAILITLGTPVARRDLDLARAMFDAVADAILIPPEHRSGEENSGAISAAVSLAAVLPELKSLTSAERGLMNEWLGRSIAELS